MNGNSDAIKKCQLVLADTSLAAASQAKCSVEMKLHIPQQMPQARGRPAETLGGYMAVPLRELRLGQGTPPFVTDDFLGAQAKDGPGVLLVLDTGSQGFWVMDFCEGANGQSLMGAATLGSLVGDYELVVGDRGGETFSIRIPQQWRDFTGADQLLATPPTAFKGSGLQCLIVGNPWMQALAMTFDVSRMRVALSHLDVAGNRCQSFQGPPSTVRQGLARASFAQQPAPLHRQRLPIREVDGKLVFSGPSLAQTSLATAAPEDDKMPVASDVTLDLRLMMYPVVPPGESSAIVARETSSAADLSEPCLDAVITNRAGRSVYVTQIFDTGSGQNLLVNVDAAGEDCAAGVCFCEGSGLVGDAFGKGAPKCGPCSSPDQAKAGGGGICNTFCCTADGVSCGDMMPCSVSYCTGVVSYKPQFTTMTFPSEIPSGSKAFLKNVPKVFAGAARPACTPGVSTGLFGAWFWDSALKSRTGKATSSKAAGLPYYLLAQLGQIGGKNENYTLKFFRSDLRAADKFVRVGQPPRAGGVPDAPTQPWWATAEGPTRLGAPAPAPSAPPQGPAPAAAPPAVPPASPTGAAPAPASPTGAPSPAGPASPTGAPPPAPAPASRKEPAPVDSSSAAGSSTFNQNRDGGVQQVVVVEREMPEQWMRFLKQNPPTSPDDVKPLLQGGGPPNRPEDLGSPGTKKPADNKWIMGLLIASVVIGALVLIALLSRLNSGDDTALLRYLATEQ